VARLEGVSKTFFPDTPGEVRALRSVNLELATGSWTIVIDTNGSGKSTLQGAAKRVWRAERLHELFGEMRREDRFDDATVGVVVPAYR
jgi:putative ABC transport system ATP-binding protein